MGAGPEENPRRGLRRSSQYTIRIPEIEFGPKMRLGRVEGVDG